MLSLFCFISVSILVGRRPEAGLYSVASLLNRFAAQNKTKQNETKKKRKQKIIETSNNFMTN
jgi:hypothetical protein